MRPPMRLRLFDGVAREGLAFEPIASLTHSSRVTHDRYAVRRS